MNTDDKKQERIDGLKKQLETVQENIIKITDELEIVAEKLNAMRMAIAIVGTTSHNENVAYNTHTLWEIYNDYLLYQNDNSKIQRDYLHRIDDLKSEISELEF